MQRAQDADRIICMEPFAASGYIIKGDALFILEQYREAKSVLEYALTNIQLSTRPVAVAGDASVAPGTAGGRDGAVLTERIRKIDEILGTGRSSESPPASAAAAATAGATAAAAAPAAPSGSAPKKLISEDNDDLNCVLCFKLLYEPVALSCGHTFCKQCLLRSLDHSNRCPTCRAITFLSPMNVCVNVALNGFIMSHFPDQYRERKMENVECEMQRLGTPESSDAEDIGAVGNLSGTGATRQRDATTLIPLFVLDSLMPRQRISLNIFEPRYRLLIRRSMNSSRTFGMIGVSRRPSNNENYLDGLNPIGCEAEIVECDCLPFCHQQRYKV